MALDFPELSVKRPKTDSDAINKLFVLDFVSFEVDVVVCSPGFSCPEYNIEATF
jgi:hypothetical protein